MSDEWETAHDDQTRRLRAQLQALRVGPRARMRKFIRLEYVCAGCGDPLLQVINTSPWPVVCTRTTGRHPKAITSPEPVREEGTSGVEHGARLYEWHKSLGPRVRIEEDWLFVPFDPAELGGAVLSSACRCRQWSGSMSMVSDDLAEPRSKRVIPRDSVSEDGNSFDMP